MCYGHRSLIEQLSYRIWYEVAVDRQTNEDSFVSFINAK